MPLEVRSVKTVARATLVVGVISAGLTAAITPRLAPEIVARWDGGFHLGMAYGLTFLSLLSFPRTRRSDLVLGVLALGLLCDLGRVMARQGLDLGGVALIAVGALAALAPSYLSRFRALVRQAPCEPFTLIFPGDRRGQGRKMAPDPREHATSQPTAA